MWVQHQSGKAITPQKTPVKQFNITDKKVELNESTSKYFVFSDELDSRAGVSQRNQATFDAAVSSEAPTTQSHIARKYNLPPNVSPLANRNTATIGTSLRTSRIQSHTSRNAQQQNEPVYESANNAVDEVARAVGARATGANAVSKTQKHLSLAVFGAVYLLGAFLSGILYQLFTSAEQLYLAYYLENLLLALNPAQFTSLFVSNFSLALVSLTAIFLSGLSAFGVPLLLMFLFCKGVGSGIVLLQLFVQYQWDGAVYYLATLGLTEVFLMTCSCVLCVTAAKNATSILKYTFLDEKTTKQKRFSRFGVQYFILLLVMLFLCLFFAVISQIIVSVAGISM